MTTEIRVTTSGSLAGLDVEATIALTKKVGRDEDPVRVAEALRAEAQALLGPRRQIEKTS